jgi:hypothetical protein
MAPLIAVRGSNLLSTHVELLYNNFVPFDHAECKFDHATSELYPRAVGVHRAGQHEPCDGLHVYRLLSHGETMMANAKGGA